MLSYSIMSWGVCTKSLNRTFIVNSLSLTTVIFSFEIAGLFGVATWSLHIARDVCTTTVTWVDWYFG